MGIRLTILDESGSILYYGSKLVGYVDSERLSCLEYLWNIRKDFLIKDRGYDDFDDFAINMECSPYTERVVKLSIPELKEFLEHYDNDLCIHEREYYIAEAVEKEIPADVEYVWLEWG